jgi:hypothetical protein
VTHFAGNVRHRQLGRGSEMPQKKELSERNIVLVELAGKVEEKLTLAEQNEICQLGMVLGWNRSALGHEMVSLKLYFLKI